MDFYVPNYVSYEMLLQSVCSRAVAGRTPAEIAYMVELAEELCRLMRELDQHMRAQ
jgi:hypothetical protein